MFKDYLNWLVLVAAYIAVLTFTFLSSVKAALPEPFRVIDGDTIEVQGKPYRIRGYDAPESYRPRCDEEALRGAQATTYLQLLLKLPEAKFIPLRSFDLYGRGLADIEIASRPLAGIMISSGLGKPYAGGRRPDWCYCLKKGTC